MKLLLKFNLVLLVVFGAGGLFIALTVHAFLLGNARREVLEQAQLMMASAQSVRDYVGSDLSPLLQQNPRHRVRFLPETIPFYGATTTFNNLRKHYPEYTYKEAALNPTNLEDRASDWEADIIHGLRNQPGQAQKIGVRDTPSGPGLYIAKPIRVTQDCLHCHSVPAAAPAAMLAVYGSANGFGWKRDEIAGAQIVSVPMSVPIAIANRAYQQLLFSLVLMMVLTMLALDAGVYWFVIRPLSVVSNTADRVSRGEKNVGPLRINGRDEIATVASSFNRMQISLAKALKMFEGQ